MPTIYFLGQIFYEVDPLLKAQTQTFDYIDAVNDLKLGFQIKIENSTIEVKCEMNRYDDFARNVASVRAWEAVRAVIAIYSFSSAIGLEVALTRCIDPTGKEYGIAHHDPDIKGLCKSYNLPHDFGAMLKLLIQDNDLFHAFRDLTQSIIVPDSEFLCGRAIERLRHGIAGHGVDPKKAWSEMHKALNLSTDYLRYITDRSQLPRHGGRFQHAPNEVKEIATRAWVVTDRYIEYRKRGSKPLPLADFPLLTG